MYERVDINKTPEFILPDKMKLSITIDDKRIKSNLKIDQILIFTEKSFFFTGLGVTQSHSYPLNDINGFYQLIAGSYESSNQSTFQDLIKFI